MPVAGAALLHARAASAQGELLAETDPQAIAVGYVADATRADAAKFPQYVAGRTCATCALYQGAPADADGVCPLFGTRHVAGRGWCSAWTNMA